MLADDILKSGVQVVDIEDPRFGEQFEQSNIVSQFDPQTGMIVDRPDMYRFDPIIPQARGPQPQPQRPVPNVQPPQQFVVPGQLPPQSAEYVPPRFVRPMVRN